MNHTLVIGVLHRSINDTPHMYPSMAVYAATVYDCSFRPAWRESQKRDAAETQMQNLEEELFIKFFLRRFVDLVLLSFEIAARFMAVGRNRRRFWYGGGLISFGVGNVFAICMAKRASAALDVSELWAFCVTWSARLLSEEMLEIGVLRLRVISTSTYLRHSKCKGTRLAVRYKSWRR